MAKNPLAWLAKQLVKEQGDTALKRLAPDDAGVLARKRVEAAKQPVDMARAIRAPSALGDHTYTPPKGKALDLSTLGNWEIGRLDPLERGSPTKVSDRALQAHTPENTREFEKYVRAGAKQGGPEWYDLSPLARVALQEMDPQELDLLIAMNAAASPRSAVADQIKRASLAWHLRAQGQPWPMSSAEMLEQFPGYGHIAHELHSSHLDRLMKASPETRKFDPVKQPKLASYYSNLSGNAMPLTADTHYQVLHGYPIKRSWSKALGEYIDSPNFRKETDYPFAEAFSQERAAKMGMTPAEYQASAWVGGKDVTGVRDARPFAEVYDDVVARTAQELGITPTEALIRHLKGEIPLRKEGGSITEKDWDRIPDSSGEVFHSDTHPALRGGSTKQGRRGMFRDRNIGVKGREMPAPHDVDNMPGRSIPIMERMEPKRRMAGGGVAKRAAGALEQYMRSLMPDDLRKLPMRELTDEPGSGRRAFKLGDDKVAKIARLPDKLTDGQYERGLHENRLANQPELIKHGLLPEVYYKDPLDELVVSKFMPHRPDDASSFEELFAPIWANQNRVDFYDVPKVRVGAHQIPQWWKHPYVAEAMEEQGLGPFLKYDPLWGDFSRKQEHWRFTPRGSMPGDKPLPTLIDEGSLDMYLLKRSGSPLSGKFQIAGVDDVMDRRNEFLRELKQGDRLRRAQRAQADPNQLKFEFDLPDVPRFAAGGALKQVAKQLDLFGGATKPVRHARRTIPMKIEEGLWQSPLEPRAANLSKELPLARVQDLNAELVAEMAGMRPAIRFNSHKLQDVLLEGRFLNQFEAKRSNGAYAPDFRRDLEQKLFGYPQRASGRMRPKYGYLGYEHSPVSTAGEGSVDIYGDMVALFKPEVRNRTTFTLGDSLDDVYHGFNPYGGAGLPAAPRPLINPSIMASPVRKSEFMERSDYYDNILDKLTKSYPEAQFHGELRLDDVERMLAPKGRKDDVWIHELKNRGIPVEFTETLGYKAGGSVKLNRYDALLDRYAKGGVIRNWLKGVKGSRLDDALSRLRTKASDGVPDVQHALGSAPDPQALERYMAHPDTQRALAMQKWVDSNLANYLTRQHGLPDDPLPALIGQRRNAVHELTADKVPYHVANDPFADLKKVEQGLPEWLRKQIEADRPRAWSERQYTEAMNDTGALMRELQDKQAGHPNTWRSELDTKYGRRFAPPVKFADLSDDRWPPYEQALSDTLDYLRTRDPKDLAKMSVPDAVRLSKQWHEQMAKKAEQAAAADIAGLPVYKQYPEGWKWVQMGGRDTALPRAFGEEEFPAHPHSKAAQAIGKQLGHCYQDPETCADYLSNSKLYSLIDPKGGAHATVEVGANGDFKKSGDPLDSIIQIRGPQFPPFDKKPRDEALPFVQDFVRSGKWGKVHETDNAGLRYVSDGQTKRYLTPEEYVREFGEDKPRRYAQGGHVSAPMRRPYRDLITGEMVGAQDAGHQALRGPTSSDLIAWVAQADGDDEEDEGGEEEAGAYLLEVLKGDGQAA